MQYDMYGRPYVEKITEAREYRILDRSPNWAAMSGWQVYQKRVNLFYKAEKNLYYLPPKYRKGKKDWIDKKIEQKKEIFELREGQKKSVEFVKENPWYSILIDSMVGTGKTVQMLGIVNMYKCKTIITAPSKAICAGIKNTFEPYFDVAVLDWKGVRKRFEQGNLPDIIVCHRQTAVNCWDIINNWEYELLLNDEQHHLSDGMKYICNTFKGKLGIVGFTWTPFRKEMEKEDFYHYFNDIYGTGLASLPVRVGTYVYKHDYTMEEYIKATEWVNPESPEVLRNLINANEERIQELKKVLKDLYFKKGFKRIMVFVDRRVYIERLQKEFPKALVIHWDSDKERVIEEAKSKDEFLLFGMVTASWEWFDVPSIQCWVLFYSTSWKGSIEQMVGRSRRFHWDKKYGYRVDFQDIGRVWENEYKKNFGAKNRASIYKENKREIFNWQEFLEDGI